MHQIFPNSNYVLIGTELCRVYFGTWSTWKECFNDKK